MSITPKPQLQSNVVVDDSDKSFTVALQKVWEIQNIRVEFTATATVGTRQLTIEVQDASSDIVYSKDGGTVVASASLTQHYAHEGAEVTMPKLTLPPGFILHVFDSAVIDPAADDMIVHILVFERDNV